MSRFLSLNAANSNINLLMNRLINSSPILIQGTIINEIIDCIFYVENPRLDDTLIVNMHASSKGIKKIHS